jgi:hypothetical protein
VGTVTMLSLLLNGAQAVPSNTDYAIDWNFSSPELESSLGNTPFAHI